MSAQARLDATHGQRQDAKAASAAGPIPFAVVALCFLLSGGAALIYQTAWLRQFSLVFGTAELALSTVLAAYMAGLAAGAALIQRWLPRIRRPLIIYAALECAIALGALAVPYLIKGIQWILITTLGSLANPPGGQSFAVSLFYVSSAFLTLGVPTLLMGATLPVLVRATVATQLQVGRRTGLLYAFNTLGAVAGTLAAGFVLLSLVGLKRTVGVGFLINLAAAALAVALALRIEPRTGSILRKSAPAALAAGGLPFGFTPWARGPVWILPIMLLSGGVSFLYEVLWTRMLSHVLGSSLLAFSTMLASALSGIVIGSALAAWIARSQRAAGRGFIVAQLLTATAAAFVYIHLDDWLPAHGGLHGDPFLALGLMLPAMLAIGASYPFAVRLLAPDADGAESAAARVYAWNTAGCVFGALLAGLAVLPLLRYEGAARAGVAGNLLLAVLAAAFAVRARVPWIISTVALAALGIFVFQPLPPGRLLRASPLPTEARGELVYYDVGRSATVVAFELAGRFVLRSNGLPEAVIDSNGAPPRFSGEYWLAPLAAIAAPRSTSMLVVGLGGGIAIDGAPPSIQAIDVIEIEPRILNANQLIAPLRRRDPLRDPRLTLVLNDARAALTLTRKHYDVILSHPSHPWTAGASHLYTREFLRLARAHLNEGGVYVQWMNVAFLDEPLLRSFAATMLDAFPELEIYRPDPETLIFVASVAPLETATRLARNSAPLWWAPDHFGRVGILAAEDVVAALVADSVSARSLAGGAPLITDDRNRLATSGIHDLGRGLTPSAAGRLLAPYDPIARDGSWLQSDAARGFSLFYIARRLARHAALDPSLAMRIDGLAAHVADQPTALYARAVAVRSRGKLDASAALIREALAEAPGNRQLLYEALRPSLGALAQGTADSAVTALANKLTGSAAAVIDATRAAGAGSWDKLASLDTTLALANPTDAWYFDAQRLRAEWRGRVSNPELRQTLGEQCLAMVDRTLVSQPEVALFELRARCAAGAGRADAMVESIFAYAVGTRATLQQLNAAERHALQSDFDALLQAVIAARAAPAIDSKRVEEVRRLLVSVGEQLRSPDAAP